MAGDDDLREHAQSSVDFYDLLGVTFETSESDIRRAYRRAALKYHPDKNADKPDIVEKFHLLQIAYDVLSQPEYKAIYDNVRRARKDKEERDRAFEGRRRQMKEDLERRESGFLKRKRDEDDEGEKLQREIQRLAEDGKRRRMEKQEQLKRERLEEEERLDREKNGYLSPQHQQDSAPKGGTEVPELDRSVKVVWPKEGRGEAIDKDRLQTMFATFGDIQNVVLLKDKKKKLGKSKSIVATGLIVYSSVVGAHAAVEDYQKQLSDPDFQIIDSVFWASKKEPEFLSTPSSETKPSRSIHDIPGLDKTPVTPLKQSGGGGGLRKVPSFASFSSAKNSPVATTATAQSPSLEELTMIRLKKAEKKRLEEQIRKQEAEADVDD